jgi:hypothetical protein
MWSSLDNRRPMGVQAAMSSSLYPDHASLPVGELRRLLAIPPTLRGCYYLECDHCGCEAIGCDDQGMFQDGDGDKCDFCGFPGQVSADGGDDDEGGYAYWSMRDWDDEAHCTLSDCIDDECIKRRAS